MAAAADDEVRAPAFEQLLVSGRLQLPYQLPTRAMPLPPPYCCARPPAALPPGAPRPSELRHMPPGLGLRPRPRDAGDAGDDGDDGEEEAMLERRREGWVAAGAAEQVWAPMCQCFCELEQDVLQRRAQDRLVRRRLELMECGDALLNIVRAFEPLQHFRVTIRKQRTEREREGEREGEREREWGELQKTKC